jgi:hypothetical protein
VTASPPRRSSHAAAATLAAVGSLVLAPSARALEPRFDHRDQDGLVLEVAGSRDTMNVRAGLSRTFFRPSLLLAWSFDVGGDGDEIHVGAGASPAVGGAPEAPRWFLDSRYRGYFGTEEWKTFFDAGLWASLGPRVAAGPRVGLGVLYDFTRNSGAFVEVGLATAFGQFRGVGLGFGGGVQVRFP